MERHSLYATIGGALTKRRRDLRKTQAEIASSAGLSRPSLANIEAGRQTLSLHQFYRLASVLEIEDARILLPDRLTFHDNEREDLDMSGELPELKKTTDISEDQQERIRRMVAETLRKKK